MEAKALSDFRMEVRAWLEKNCPPGVRNVVRDEHSSFWGGRKAKFANEDQKVWFERMVAKGWTAPDWPEEYGGAGLSFDETRILQQELKRIEAAPALTSLGLWQLAPVLFKYGNEAQRREHLPKIARGEIRWAQGYSEPGAGSDLASLRTKGEDKGDHFLVNGSKIWTSGGDKADMIYALVRTEPEAPKHQGISFCLVDMDQPGVSTRPITLIAGDAPFVQTFFDNAIALKENVIGERGQGWTVAKYLLEHERQGIGSMMGGNVSETVAAMAKRLLGAEGLARDPALRQAIALHEMDTMAMAIAIERERDRAKVGQNNPLMANVLKLYGTEGAYRRSEFVMSLGGADHLELEGRPAQDWLHAPANCIAGGSNEVQLNILSKRALGLPER